MNKKIDGVNKKSSLDRRVLDWGVIKMQYLKADTFEKAKPWLIRNKICSPSTAYAARNQEMLEEWDRLKDEYNAKRTAALFSHDRIGKELEQSLVKLTIDKLNIQEARRKRIEQILMVLNAAPEDQSDLRKKYGLYKLDEALSTHWRDVKADLGEPTTVSHGSIHMQQNFINLKNDTRVEITLDKLMENDKDGEIQDILAKMEKMNEKAKELENMSPADKYLSQHKGEASKTSTDTPDAVFSSKETDTDVNTDQ